MTGLSIRKAKVSDVPAIYQLVKELAVYEKAGDEVSASIEDYNTDFLEGIFQALVAEREGQVVGAAIYYMTYSTWKGRMMYLEDFIVTRAYRREGIGQLLFDAFLREAERQNARLVKWQVLDWNEPAIRFYWKNDAVIERDWLTGKKFLVKGIAKKGKTNDPIS